MFLFVVSSFFAYCLFLALGLPEAHKIRRFFRLHRFRFLLLAAITFLFIIIALASFQVIRGTQYENLNISRILIRHQSIEIVTGMMFGALICVYIKYVRSSFIFVSTPSLQNQDGNHPKLMSQKVFHIGWIIGLIVLLLLGIFAFQLETLWGKVSKFKTSFLEVEFGQGIVNPRSLTFEVERKRYEEEILLSKRSIIGHAELIEKDKKLLSLTLKDNPSLLKKRLKYYSFCKRFLEAHLNPLAELINEADEIGYDSETVTDIVRKVIPHYANLLEHLENTQLKQSDMEAAYDRFREIIEVSLRGLSVLVKGRSSNPVKLQISDIERNNFLKTLHWLKEVAHAYTVLGKLTQMISHDQDAIDFFFKYKLDERFPNDINFTGVLVAMLYFSNYPYDKIIPHYDRILSYIRTAKIIVSEHPHKNNSVLMRLEKAEKIVRPEAALIYALKGIRKPLALQWAREDYREQRKAGNREELMDALENVGIVTLSYAIKMRPVVCDDVVEANTLFREALSYSRQLVDRFTEQILEKSINQTDTIIRRNCR